MRHILVLFETGEIKEVQLLNEAPVVMPLSKGEFHCRTNKQKYTAAVNKLLQHIQRGDIYEINYCIEFYAINVVIDCNKVFALLKELTGAPFAGMYAHDGKIILCASPERFLKKEGSRLITQPMKGTAPRGATRAGDEQLKKDLAQSLKEQTENVMAVDVARNDLARIAKKGSVITTDLFGVQTFTNVHQMVSTVECQLNGTSLREIISATFPPASMTGAPKISACKLIAKYELSPRGIYSGCIGRVEDNGDMDLSVVIRTIIYDPAKKYLSFHVGSAITAAADPGKEWDECLLKAEALLKALGVDLSEVVFGK